MFRSLRCSACLVWLLALVWGSDARAVLTIEITKGIEGAIPIAVVPFGANSALPVDVAQVIQEDLARSARFKPLPKDDMLTRPTAPEQILWQSWRVLGQDYLVIGQVQPVGAERFEVQFYLYDVFSGQELINYRLPVGTKDLRRAAHKISDLIYEKITGEPGIFSSRIAYVTVGVQNRKRLYKLQIADADGYNPRTVVISPEPLMSPVWSPDGKKLAYVSFESRRPAVYIQTLSTGERIRVAQFPGINGAPAWSPDGSKLAMTLSKDGSPDIYVLDLATRQLRRLTESAAIDTEPAWSPDGKTIAFTSDRGGSPQIYVMAASGGVPRRLTFQGNYNARPVFSRDGDRLAFVHGSSGYKIAVLNLQDKAMTVLTSGPLDESPSFAPNDRLILYATRGEGRRQLAVVSVDGKIEQRLKTEEGDVREPAWSPF
ncbi:MAG: Tol-Pal system beta propeller repeat protein TolB [Methylohalobius sp.]|nr:Tol-Pal system beta propeller repeat protein TolB [Methylohalobius sp.]